MYAFFVVAKLLVCKKSIQRTCPPLTFYRSGNATCDRVLKTSITINYGWICVDSVAFLCKLNICVDQMMEITNLKGQAQTKQKQNNSWLVEKEEMTVYIQGSEKSMCQGTQNNW